MFSGRGIGLEPHELKSPFAPTPSLKTSEIIDWNDATAQRWKALLAAHPEALEFPCDVYGVKNVGGLLRHIFAVETRYAERLSGEPVTAYEQIPDGSAELLFGLHDAAVEKYRKLLADESVDWDEKLEFTTVSMGTKSATRKTILFHSLLHGIRHYAQLATTVRQNGVKPDWPMDYLFMGVS
jgi:uncharacterized damage-inducible protein DinB